MLLLAHLDPSAGKRLIRVDRRVSRSIGTESTSRVEVDVIALELLKPVVVCRRQDDPLAPPIAYRDQVGPRDIAGKPRFVPASARKSNRIARLFPEHTAPCHEPQGTDP